MVYAFLFSAVSILFRIIYSFRIEGRENLTAYKTNGRPFVIVANHLSVLDPIFIVMAWGFGRRLSIMGKAELFKNPILGWIFTKVGCFPVDRGKADVGAIDKAIDDIKDGHGMLIFPEGTRGDSDEMLRFKSGAFMVAAQTGADIIPVRMVYPTKSRRMRFFAPVVVKIGQPVLAEDMNMTGGSRRALRAAKATVRGRIEDLLTEYNASVGYVPPALPQASAESAPASEEEA